ncbi:MAG TPA: sigma-70 family RNA polymerase sigma factor [Acidimicrobiales bacterium]|nr:sigma-70 family RNA polymerase sigma factor [Acidimicrobiales bacterium]
MGTMQDSCVLPSSPRAQPDLAQLWRRYWDGRDPQARNRLLLAYEPIIHAVVVRLPAHIRATADAEDLHSFGVFGLIDAIEKCDEASDVARFPAYASYRVRGAIIDELRRLDWLPRTVRRRVAAYRTAFDELASELGRPPEHAEVLSSLDLDPRAGLHLLQDLESSRLVHLYQHGVSADVLARCWPVGKVGSDDDDEPERRVLDAERSSSLRAAIERLVDRQRTVITLRYLSGLTQQQVAAVLGVTNARICQIEAAAMRKLRGLLSATEREACTTGASRPCVATRRTPR